MKRASWIPTRGATFALFACLWLACGPEESPPAADNPTPPKIGATDSQEPPIVILISLDTLRADHLGAYGYGEFTSPVLDTFGAEGVIFDDANAVAPWTLPSTASMLTGVYPLRHGVVDFDVALSSGVPTLAETLGENGFVTAAVVNAVHLRQESFQVTRGFHRFELVHEAPHLRSPTTFVTEQAMEWVKEYTDRPLFLFVHYFDVHAKYTSLPAYEKLFVAPYDGPFDGGGRTLFLATIEEEWAEACQRGEDPDNCNVADGIVVGGGVGKLDFGDADVRHLEQLYDAGIRQMDTELGRFFSFLRREGVMDRAHIVITSDHGEEFAEHGGFQHSRTQYQELLHIPLLMRGPGIPKGQRIQTPVSLVDLAPTLLSLAGVDADCDFDGIDLTTLWQPGAEASAQDRDLFGEAPFIMKGSQSLDYRSIRRGQYKLHHNRVADTYELYDLELDPLEQDDISSQHPDRVAAMAARLIERHDNAVRDGTTVELDEGELRQLQALGYIGN